MPQAKWLQRVIQGVENYWSNCCGTGNLQKVVLPVKTKVSPHAQLHLHVPTGWSWSGPSRSRRFPATIQWPGKCSFLSWIWTVKRLGKQVGWIKLKFLKTPYNKIFSKPFKIYSDCRIGGIDSKNSLLQMIFSFSSPKRKRLKPSRYFKPSS